MKEGKSSRWKPTRDYMTVGFSKEKEDLEVEVEVGVQCKIESSIYAVSFALLY